MIAHIVVRRRASATACLRGVVGQAEDGDIGAVQQVLAHRGIAALGFRNGQKLDIASGRPCGVRICRPVVPCSPSMKIFGAMINPALPMSSDCFRNQCAMKLNQFDNRR